ncbi:MAG TPA: DUF2079 domain-containing protein, partial [Polyangiales bacterium]|nr:DUF2079 domain-containing protein [Polyangiales bacterium]
MLAANGGSVKGWPDYTRRVFPRRTRLALGLAAGLQLGLLLGLSWARYANVHQRTFDLALYARTAWGLAHGDGWAPLLGTSALGCHLSPVLLPLGLLGRVFGGTVPVLLAAQAACIALMLFPLARIGARRQGMRGVWLAAAAWLLYPNLFHVGTYEFHPGTLAVLPMTWAFDALDRGNLKQLGWCTLATLCCREELGAFAAIMFALHYWDRREKRALYGAALSMAYMIAGLIVVSAHAPVQGSADAHFGVWGGSPFGVVRALFTEPGLVFAHFKPRLSYLPRLLAPLSFFSLLAPRLLLPALPYVALNMISAFPTALQQYSHYLTPAVPALIVSGLVGVSEVRARFPRVTWFVALGIAHFALGGSPLSYDFDRSAFVEDDATRAARRVLAKIPADASVQAPYALLPHLAERKDLRRAPPPDAGLSYTVIDVSHRQRYARQETLLRTSEEPLIRRWLARRDTHLIEYAPPYALFVREPAELPKSCVGSAAASTPMTSCLSVASARIEADELVITTVAQSACPADLALRFSVDDVHWRTELLC